MEKDYFENEPKYSIGFYIAIAALALFTMMGFGIDFDEFQQRETLNIPDWYFYIIFAVDFLAILSVIGIAFFKKIAIYAFPSFVVLHFFMHQYYLSTFLYTDVTNLFLYVGAGLLMMIPKWHYFK